MSQPLSSPPIAPSDAIHASKLRRLLQRAEAYRAAGQREAAIATLEAALQLQPDHAPFLLQLAELHLEAERHNAALTCTLQAAHAKLDSPRTALTLMRMLKTMSASGLMLEIAAQLPPPMWDSAKSLTELAQELTLAGALGPARGFAQAAVSRDPHYPPGLAMHATLDLFHGDLSAAAEHSEKCLAALPGDPGSHWLLSRLRQPHAERRVERIERELARDPRGEDEARLAYALHNELHDLREHERAWQALERACRAKRATLNYSPAQSDALFDALCEWGAGEIDPADGWQGEERIPVFIIGLHRSGTTLAERILSGHSQVAQGGETYDIRAQLRRASGLHYPGELDARLVAARRDLDYRAIGQGYLHGMTWRAAGKRVVTDKLPSNYLNVGFIARALPHARFIHLRRDPVDVGLSSLRTLFSHACPYSYDQAEYVAHHGNYRRLMARWRQLLPDRILDVDYQDLVDAPEAGAERIARFCGLDYEAAMVRIEGRGDAVSTASSVMMRDGIRRDRGQVWKAYERQLQPMITAFAGER